MVQGLIKDIEKYFSETGSYPNELSVNGYVLKKGALLKQFLNSVFGEGTINEAYDISSTFSKGAWDMGGTQSIFITTSGKVVHLSNSEWGSMRVAGRVKQG